jgi:hypothetical protein
MSVTDLARQSDSSFRRAVSGSSVGIGVMAAARNSVRPGGTRVDRCSGQAADVVEKMLFSVMGEVMGRCEAEFGIDSHAGFRAEGVPYPAHTQLAHFLDAVDARH